MDGEEAEKAKNKRRVVKPGSREWSVGGLILKHVSHLGLLRNNLGYRDVSLGMQKLIQIL